MPEGHIRKKLRILHRQFALVARHVTLDQHAEHTLHILGRIVNLELMRRYIRVQITEATRQILENLAQTFDQIHLARNFTVTVLGAQ